MYRARVTPPPNPGGFWIRIALLGAALLSLLALNQRCSSGVAGMFEQIAPPPKSQPAGGAGIQFAPPSEPAPTSQGVGPASQP